MPPFSIIQAFNSENMVVANYGLSTSRLIGSGLCFQRESAGLRICFEKDGDILIRRLSDVVYGRANWDSSRMPQLRGGAWKITGFKRWAILNLSPGVTFGVPINDHKDDDHGVLTRQAAIEAFGSLATPFFGFEADGREGERSALTDEVAARDFPPIPGGTLADFLLTVFDEDLQSHRHALRSLTDDSENPGYKRLEDIEETRLEVRGEVDRLVERLARDYRALGRSRHILTDYRGINQLIGQIEQMRRAFNDGDYGTAASIITQLRPNFFFPRQRDIVFPDNDPSTYQNKEVLDFLIEAYEDFASFAISARDEFTKAAKGDTAAVERGEGYYRRALDYLREDLWDKMAKGWGPESAVAQKRLGALTHLIQDNFAHCDELSGNTCLDPVAINTYAMGPQHQLHHDKAREGRKFTKPAQRAIEVTKEALLLVSRVTPDMFGVRKAEFLDKYWPEPVDWKAARAKYGKAGGQSPFGYMDNMMSRSAPAPPYWSGSRGDSEENAFFPHLARGPSKPPIPEESSHSDVARTPIHSPPVSGGMTLTRLDSPGGGATLQSLLLASPHASFMMVR